MLDKIATALPMIVVLSACAAPDAETIGRPGRSKPKKSDPSSVAATPVASAAPIPVTAPSADNPPKRAAPNPKACLDTTSAEACRQCCNDANADGKTKIDDAKGAYAGCVCTTECERECRDSQSCEEQPERGILLDRCGLCVWGARSGSACQEELAPLQTDPEVAALNECYAGSNCANK